MKTSFRLSSPMLVLFTAMIGLQGASAALTLWIDAGTKEYYFTGSDSLTPGTAGDLLFQWGGGDQTTNGGFLVPNELLPASAFSASYAFTVYEEEGFVFSMSLNSPSAVTISGDGTRVSYDPAVNTFNSVLTPGGQAALEAIAAANTVFPVLTGSGESLTVAAVPEPSSTVMILGGLCLCLLRSRRRGA